MLKGRFGNAHCGYTSWQRQQLRGPFNQQNRPMFIISSALHTTRRSRLLLLHPCSAWRNWGTAGWSTSLPWLTRNYKCVLLTSSLSTLPSLWVLGGQVRSSWCVMIHVRGIYNLKHRYLLFVLNSFLKSLIIIYTLCRQLEKRIKEPEPFVIPQLRDEHYHHSDLSRKLGSYYMAVKILLLTFSITSQVSSHGTEYVFMSVIPHGQVMFCTVPEPSRNEPFPLA